MDVLSNNDEESKMSDSYKSIMKTTGLVGAVQVIRLLFGLIRNKLIALYFGASGIGLWSLYLSFTEMIQSATSLGLEKSAVKQIAENDEDLYQRNLAIQVLMFSLTVVSFLISIVIAIFSAEFSLHIFGSTDYRFGILVCCGVIFFNTVATACRSILNGLSEIKKLALSQLIGMLVGNIIVFSLIPFFSSAAIPIYLLIIAITSFIPTLYFIKKLKISFSKIIVSEAFQTLSSLMKIGLAFWVSAMFMTFMTYITNLFLKDNLSMEALGLYQASWTISNLYIGIILTSMGVAFFPKICKVISNQAEATKTINEQIEFGLLVSFPFIIGIYVFAPLVLHILYSSEFTDGASIIRWQMLGVTIRLLGFPFGYALMAKGKTIQYTLSQFIFSGLNYAFIVWITLNVGFDGLGVNYFAAYIVYTILIGSFCYRAIGYKFSPLLIRIFGIYILAFSILAFSLQLLTSIQFFIFGTLIVLLTSYHSFIELQKQLNIDVIKLVRAKLKV